MSTSKYFERICCVVLALALILTVVFMNSEALGLAVSSNRNSEYENKLFDTSKVHTINILIDDWDSFVENATSEEYTQVDLEIDGEPFYNAAIRAKGNTSLSSVEAYGNNRYSFKIEFDHYNDSSTYYGLDKLALNNIIQDNTYMKDYISYMMMAQFDVDAPLASYTQIFVNGEEWGLYLAVEGIEEAFMQRNYGSLAGELYQPDSMSMGENSDKPDMSDFNPEDFEDMMEQVEDGQMPGAPDNVREESSETKESDDASLDTTEDNTGESFGFPGGGPGGMGSNDVALVYSDDDPDSYSNIFNSAKTDITTVDKKRLIQSLKKLNNNEDIENVVDTEEVMRYFVVHNFLVSFDSYTGSMMHNYYLYEEDGQLSMIPWDYNLAFGAFGGMEGGSSGGMGGKPGTATTETTADTADTIKTTEAASEQSASMPAMDGQQPPAGMQMPDGMTPSTEEGNMDSTEDGTTAPANEGMTNPFDGTGEGGMPEMGGGLGASSANSTINYPIDDPLSGATMDQRPMIAWIFNNDTYLNEYHELFGEFITQFFETDEVTKEIQRVKNMIAPYVESDPTKFCTYEEFETGVDALIDFMNLRAESVSGQLNGTIPSTSEGQEADNSAFVDASNLNLNDMGTMGGPDGSDADSSEDKMAGGSPAMPGQTNVDEAAPDDGSSTAETGVQGSGQMPADPGAVPGANAQDNSARMENLILLGVSLAFIIVAIIVARCFRRRG